MCERETKEQRLEMIGDQLEERCEVRKGNL